MSEVCRTLALASDVMMPSTLKSNQQWWNELFWKKDQIIEGEGNVSENPSSSDPKPRRRGRGNKANSKWKQRRQTMKRDWLLVPSDVMADIIRRVGVIDILENVQKVCTTWRRICKDPSMWRIIDMDARELVPGEFFDLEKMCMHAVDLSEGQLMDIKIKYFGSCELLQYIADRSRNLRHLQIVVRYCWFEEHISELLKKFRLLEELYLHGIELSVECIEVAGRCCPMLKSLKLNREACKNRYIDMSEEAQALRNEEAIAIAQNLPKLRHLQLIGNEMSDVGLKAILDDCTNLESLDLRRCQNISSFDAGLMKRCSEQIRFVRFPEDSLEDYEFDAELYDHSLDCWSPCTMSQSPYEYSDFYDDDDDDDDGYGAVDDFTVYDRCQRF